MLYSKLDNELKFRDVILISLGCLVENVKINIDWLDCK